MSTQASRSAIHLKVFANKDAADKWLKGNDSEGVAFAYAVIAEGKAARNERIKLDATTANNIAIGLTLAGVLLPVLSLYMNPFVSGDELLHAAFSLPGIFKGIGVIVALSAAHAFL